MRGRGRRRRRRARKKESFSTKPDKSFVLMHVNPRGYRSKEASIEDAIDVIDPSIVTMNETGLTSKNKIFMKSYISFCRNRNSGQKMGGIATCVKEEMKEHAVLVKEGENNDEFHIVRLDCYNPPLNIVNCYGEQEHRLSQEETEARWARMVREMEVIRTNGEHCLLVSDANKHIGNDELGVHGNHPFISRGGHMVRALLSTGDWVLVNNIPGVVEGGPFTREDPVTGRLTCLDIMICSAGLVPFICKLVIDSNREVAARRAVHQKGRYRVINSDHFTLILTMNLPNKIKKAEKATKWNLKKVGGWQRYENSQTK